MRRLFATAAIIAAISGSAHAAGGFSDNFNSENGGLSAQNYTDFSNWTVTAGTVDLAGPGNPWGISCFGGTGSCVNLDGVSGQSGTLTSNSFDYSAGDKVTISFELSGNQTLFGADDFFSYVKFLVPTSIINYQFGGGFGDLYVGNISNLGGASISWVTAYNVPFTLYTTTFDVLNAGALTTSIGQGSTAGWLGANDGAGPVLDSYDLSISSAPEPGTWAMMLLGCGLIGAALRRRYTHSRT